MTIKITGNIHMGSTNCLRCSGSVKVAALDQNNTIGSYAKCESCGATYTYKEKDVASKHIDYFFEFKEFSCVAKEPFKESCNNGCPGPEMFCKVHLTDEAFEKAIGSIKYASQRLDETVKTMDSMKESKRLWLINEMSGLDEQDDTVSDGENG